MLQGIKACVFDAYGTLFDVHSAVNKRRARIGEDADRMSQLWRRKQLEYTWLRSLMGAYADFWQITGDALDYAMETYGLADEALRDDLMRAYLDLDCFPEVRDTLTVLKARHLKIALLSNGTRRMIEAVVHGAGLAHLVDEIYTVDDLSIYKPHAGVYRLACERLDVSPEAISFQSANAWDASGAAYFGFRVVWINRAGQKPERLPGRLDAELATLADLPALLS